MAHRATRGFWSAYRALPAEIREHATKQFALLKSNPQHPSVQLKKIGERDGREIWSARVTLRYRCLAVKLNGDLVWFWIGSHSEYDSRVS